MIVSIHQPQYLPWPAYIYKLMMSDVFVVYDTVQYNRGYANRNLIKSPQGAIWLTIPVRRTGLATTFENAEVQSEIEWASRHSLILDNNYKKSRGWPEIAAEFHEIYERGDWTLLTDVDVAFLSLIIRKLNLKTKLVRASSLAVDPSISAIDRLIQLTRMVGGDTYLSGRGGGGLRYVSETTFNESGVQLLSYDFASPVYTQLWDDFIPDLSIVDLIACAGLEGASRIISTSGHLRPWPSDPK